MSVEYPVTDLRYHELRARLRNRDIDISSGIRSLFRYGYRLDAAGKLDDADLVYRATIDLLEELYTQKHSSLNMQAYADLAFHHGFCLHKLGRLEPALRSYQEAVYKYRAFISMCTSSHLVAKLAATLRWLATAKHQVGNPTEACGDYREAISLYKSILRYGPLGDERTSLKQLIMQISREYRTALNNSSAHGTSRLVKNDQ